MQLKIIIASTRPGRKGPIIAKWFEQYAKEQSNFEVEILDLKEINLPFLDEEIHPIKQQYKEEHTKNWSKKIDEADAFVVVTPEYNFGMSAPLKNALDYLHKEWSGKVMGFVSYGGISAGTRAVQHIKLPVTTLGMMPIPQAVNIPFFSQFIADDGEFRPNNITIEAASKMLTELEKWAFALKEMRVKNLTNA